MRTILFRWLVVLALVLISSCQKKEEKFDLCHSLSKDCSQFIVEICDLDANLRNHDIPTIAYVIKDENTRTNIIEILLKNQQEIHEITRIACLPNTILFTYNRKEEISLVFNLDGNTTSEIIEILRKTKVNPVGKSTYGDYGERGGLAKRLAWPSQRFSLARGYKMTEDEFAKIIQRKSQFPVETEGGPSQSGSQEEVR